jgi:putative membrane protein
MLSVPLPVNETQRQQALDSLELLDTPADPYLDALTRLAHDLFGVRTALITLVDRDRQWFKSRQGLDVAETPRSLMITDIAYGICAGLVLLTGAARLLWFGKGTAYYLGNSLFHAKVGLFILTALLSILPTWVFFNWRNAVRAGQAPTPSPRQIKLVTWSIRLELLLLLVIPLLAALMARGYGVIAAG